MISADILRRLGNPGGPYLQLTTPLAAACAEFRLSDPRVIAMLLAQLCHESVGFTRLEESFAYRSADRLLAIFPNDFADLADAEAVRRKGPQAIANRVYARQNGNGSEESGDGWRYFGRGLIQLTGRANYQAAGEALGLPLLQRPEVAAAPDVAARTALWYFTTVRDCVTPAKVGDIVRVTRLINGGTVGLKERADLYRKACQLLGVQP